MRSAADLGDRHLVGIGLFSGAFTAVFGSLVSAAFGDFRSPGQAAFIGLCVALTVPLVLLAARVVARRTGPG